MSSKPESQSAADATEGVDLESYVADNPEEVARFLERIEVVNDLLDLGDVATSAMDDEMVESLADSGTNLAMAADGMATEEVVQLGESVGENATEVSEGLETVARLQRTGTLDDLAELADLASLMTAAMDDEMATSVASTGSRLAEVADTAADDDVAGGLEDILVALGEASTEDSEPVGALGMMKAIRDPEVKAGLGALLSIASALGRQQGGPGE
jgi:uncharacterized protein YjgD (DUF1641 family)